MNSSTLIFLIALQAVAIFGQDAKYVGCYKDAPTRDLGNFNNLGNNNDAQACIAVCKLKGFKYAGLQYTRQCFCGDTFGRYGKRPESECSADCPGERTHKCGGTWRNSIYSTGYLGCWRDSLNRAMKGFENKGMSQNNVAKCILLCRSKGFKYAGLQFTNECFCDNEYQKYGEVGKGECNKVCPGNRNQKCGGTWRFSAYATARF